MKLPKMPDFVENILRNKMVLNIVTILSLINVIGHIIMGNLDAALYFIILASLIVYFTKNMIIVLGVPLILVNLFILKNSVFVEGMENAKTKVEEGMETELKGEHKLEPEEYKKTIGNINKQSAKTKSGLQLAPIDETVVEDTKDESFEVGRGKRRKGTDIDYASTIEDAYDELNNILGSDGIKSLTNDTQNLMKQQAQLAESMKSITPLVENMRPIMEQAQSMLKQMEDGGNLGDLMKMANKFTGK